MSSISIKQLPQVNEINSDDLLLIQTPTASNTLEFKDFIIGLENTTFANTISTFNTEIESLSSKVHTLSSSDITNTDAIATNTTDIAANTTNLGFSGVVIDVNAANIATNTANIATNTADIATNTANIATNTTFIGQFATSQPIAEGTPPTANHSLTLTINGTPYKILLNG